MPAATTNNTQDLDLKVLSRCIYELNITRRYIISYPPNHPIIETAARKAYEFIEKLLEFQPSVTLGIARNVLIFNSGVLDRKNPIYADFAGYLFAFGIATITISKEIPVEELVAFFLALTNSPENVREQGRIVAYLNEAEIRNIQVEPIDYSSFRVSEDSSITAPGGNVLEHEAAALWGRFVEGLMQNTLDPTGGGITSTDQIDPERLAAFMNERAAQLTDSSNTSYDAAITSFMRQMDRDNLAHKYDADSFQKLGEFVKNLSPDLRRQFLQSTFDTLQGGDSVKKLLSQFPDEVIMDALDDVSEKGSHLSQGVVNLLQIIAKTGKGISHPRKSKAAAQMSKEELTTKLKDIFREDEPSKYITDSYRTTLKSIASIERFSVLTPEESRGLREQIDALNIESRISDVIIHIIDLELEQEDAQILQQNLTDLCEVYLKSGDYRSLANVHMRLSAKCHGGTFGLLPIHEAVFAKFFEPEFLEEILNGLTIWGKNKYEEIKTIILGVGDPFIEPLIQRLAEEPNLSFRRFFMACLKDLGNEAKHAAISHLLDTRWYVVRNMVVLLRSYNDSTVLPHFRLIAEHPHPKVRQEVIRTLFAFRHSEADRLLQKEFRSSNHEIVLSAIQIAENSKNPATVACLRKVLSMKLLAKAEYELQSAAVKSLGKIADSSVLPDFERILAQKSLFVTNLLNRLKLDIVRSLEQYPLSAVGPLLDKIQQSGVAELAPTAAGIKKKLETRAFYEP